MEFILIVMHPGRDVTFEFECSACHKTIWMPTAQRTLDYEYCPYCGNKADKDEPAHCGS